MNDNALKPILTSDFLRLAHLAGISVTEDDLNQLQKRQFLPTHPDPSLVFSPAHLYVLGLYFDAVQVIRHPWVTRPSDRKIEDVKAKAVSLQRLLDAIDKQTITPAVADEAGTIIIEMERFLANIDPFGPLANVVDILRPEVLDQFRGAGRLYVELRRVATSIAAQIEQILEPENTPHTGEIPEDEDDDPRRTASMDIASIQSDSLSSHTVHERPTVERQITPGIQPIATPTPTRPVTPLVPEPVASRPQPEPTPEPQKPVEELKPVVENRPMPAVETTQAALAPTPVIAQKQSSWMDDFDEDEGTSEPTSLIELSSAKVKASESKPEPATTPAPEPDKKLEEAPEEEPNSPEEIARQIEELNRLRETYIQTANWPALAALYEERIELFEDPAEREQIHLALGAIYESKLQQPRIAFDSYLAALDSNGPASEKAFEGLRRTGRHPDSRSSYISWLEKNLNNSKRSVLQRRELQTEFTGLLKDRGEGQRAFLLYAAFLAGNPEENLAADTLAHLEDLGADQGEDGLDEFFADILESTSNPRVLELVGLKAAMSFLSRGQNLHAIRYLRKVLEAAPNNEVAFSNLSRLYEAEQNFGELAQIIRARITRAPADHRPRLEAALDRAYEQELRNDADAVIRWVHLLDQSPDDPFALRRAVFGFTAHQRHSDAYAFLTKLATNVKTSEQRATILVELARIAVDHLNVLEEGRDFLEAALDLVGPTKEVLGGFVDLHMAKEDFINAIATIDSLLAVGSDLSKDQQLEWLRVGVEAAEIAERQEDRERFLAQIRQLESVTG